MSRIHPTNQDDSNAELEVDPITVKMSSSNSENNSTTSEGKPEGKSSRIDENAYPCLSEERVKQLRDKGKTPDQIRSHNDLAKHDLDLLCTRNNICTGSKNRGEAPTLYFLGGPKEGKTSLSLLLQNDEDQSDTNIPSMYIGNEIEIPVGTALSLLETERIKQKIRINKDSKSHIYLIVISCSANRMDRGKIFLLQNVKRIVEMHGRVRCLLVLTHASTRLNELSLRRHVDAIVQEDNPLSSLYATFYPNILAVEANEKTPYGIRIQKELIMDHISRMLYISKHFEKGEFGQASIVDGIRAFVRKT